MKGAKKCTQQSPCEERDSSETNTHRRRTEVKHDRLELAVG